MIIHNILQNSEEWDKLRLGKFTASSCAELLSNPKTKGYQKLVDKVFEEQYTGMPCESITFSGNSFTDRGHELETAAIDDFELNKFHKVDKVGFVEKDSFTGCSPDGLIGKDGLIQIKCPIFNTQIEYIRKNEVPTKYYKQMQFELFVSERKWNIFYSYHPALPFVCIKLERDEELIKEIKTRLDIAINEVKEKLSEVKSWVAK